MYKKVLLLATALMVSGCGAKKDACALQEHSDVGQLFMKDEIYHKSLMNTQKAQLIASFETKALLTATYLNPVFAYESCQEDTRKFVEDGEYFFVGVFISDSKTHQFNKKGYSLTLNGEEPLEITPLEKDDPLRYEMPMVDNWSTYYRVKFKKVKTKDFTLVFESNRFGKDILKFSKTEKSLLDSLKY